MKVLIIRFSSIGDILLCTPVIRCVHQQWKAEVTLLTSGSMKSLLDTNPYLSAIVTDEGGLLQTREWIKAQDFDLVIDLHKNRKSFFLTMFSRVKTIGYSKLNLRKWWYVQTKVNVLPSLHLVDRYFQALAGEGLVNDGEGLDYFLKDEMPHQALPAEYNVIVLGAAHRTKRIPESQAITWAKTSHYPIIAIGGKDVLEEGSALENLLDGKLMNLCGRLTISQSANVLARAKTVLTGDTGMMHLAAALKKPMVVLWGNTTPAFGMYPYFGKHPISWRSEEVTGLSCRPCSKLGYDKCPKGHFKCMMEHKAYDW